MDAVPADNVDLVSVRDVADHACVDRVFNAQSASTSPSLPSVQLVKKLSIEESQDDGVDESADE